MRKSIIIFLLIFLISCSKKIRIKEEKTNKNNSHIINSKNIKEQHQDLRKKDFIIERNESLNYESVIVFQYIDENEAVDEIFRIENVRNPFIYKSLCFYEVNKSDSDISDLYYIDKEESVIKEHYISPCFGCYKIMKDKMINVRNPYYPYLVDIYSLEKFSKIKEIDLKDLFLNKPYLVDEVKVELQENDDFFQLDYYDQWNEIFESFSIEISSLGVLRNETDYSKNKYINPLETKKIKRKTYSMSKSKKIQKLGLWINWNIIGDNSFFIDSKPNYLENPTNPIWKMENVTFYLFNEEKNTVLLMNKPTENKDCDVNILDINSNEEYYIGRGKCQPILTEDSNYVAFIQNETKTLHIRNINNLYEDGIDKSITDFLDQDYIDCDFVSFDYPLLGILFKFKDSFDKFVIIDLASEKYILEDVNKEKEIVPDLPSIH